MNINLFIEIMVGATRNSELENIHSGKSPVSKTGDFSDVYVVTPDRNIPWNEVSRITNKEMGPLKDSIRISIKDSINILMENGLEFNVKENSVLANLLNDKFSTW